MTSLGRFVATPLFVLAAACSSTSSGSDATEPAGSTVTPSPGDAQTPGTGRTSVETWLTGGAYRAWASESAIHPSRAPSPHGFNRIYSNGTLSAAAAASTSGDWPVGSAAVKELYASANDTTPIGYAVYLKLKPDSAGGANWYWYERVPADSAAPHDANGVVADGYGDSGPAKTICVGCHSGAGTDAAHTPSVGGRDQVYTPVL